MEFTFRPIEKWPTNLTTARKKSAFKSSYQETLRLLDRELRYLRAKNIVLQVALADDKIRLDGRPYATARPDHPGVILAFESKFGPLSYPCDTFSSWEENLRAIALALQCLRTVDRYGVTRRGEQYSGWTAPVLDITPFGDSLKVRKSRKNLGGHTYDSLPPPKGAAPSGSRPLARTLHVRQAARTAR